MLKENDYVVAAMEIISIAGDGRALVSEAVHAAMQGDYQTAEKKLKESYDFIKKAHISQTKVIQEEMNDNENSENAAKLLFTHAQDTIMTINSEYLVLKQMVEMMKKMEERITKLEEKIDG